jgi:4-hydroxybenzoate polyprenyltransferase
MNAFPLSTLEAAPAKRGNGILGPIRRELALSWGFIRRDLTSAVAPGLLFAIAARRAVGPSTALAHLAAFGRAVLYFWLFLYAFCLLNQIVGVDEDRVNKPDRPIPSGAVSLAGARVRFVIALAALLAVGQWLGVLAWAAAWALLILLADLGGWARHWLTKNVGVVGIGALVQLAAAWRLAAPGVAMPWRTIFVLSGLLGVSMCIQDFRDIAGDRATGRRTLPIALGENPARWVSAAWFVIMPALLHVGLMAPLHAGVAGLAGDVVMTALSLSIAVRLVRLRTPAADHRTYLLLPLLYCVQTTIVIAIG